MSLLSMMLGQPMYITQQGLELMMAIAARETLTPSMLEQYPGQPASDDRFSQMTIRGDVGIIPIQGPIFRHATLFRQISGATTTQQIAKDIGEARKMSEIKSVVLEINSPGGEASSIGELAGMIRELNDEKPVTARGDFMIGSAAYYLFAAAGRRVTSPASFLGSIGTISAWTSTKKAREALGLQDITVVSPQTPKKGIDAESPEGLAQLQDHLRFMSDHFIDDVARFTGHSRKRVMEDFGQGALVNADTALKVGMVDAFDTLEGTIARISGGRKYKISAPVVGAASGSGSMAKKTLGQWLLGSRVDEPAPDALQDDPHGGRGTGDGEREDNDEKESLRAELREANRLRAEAEAREQATKNQSSIDLESHRIQAKVAGWVRTGRIDPAQTQKELDYCRNLSVADNALRHSGQDSLLVQHEATIDARKDTGVCTERIPGNQDVSGGRIVTPPAGPAPTTDQAVQDEFDRTSARNSSYAGAGRNGSKSSIAS